MEENSPSVYNEDLDDKLNEDYFCYVEDPEKIPDQWSEKYIGVTYELDTWNDLNPSMARQQMKDYFKAIRFAGDALTNRDDQYRLDIRVKKVPEYVWYEEITNYETVNMPQNSFEEEYHIGDTVTIKHAPSRNGYEFQGWRLYHVYVIGSNVYMDETNILLQPDEKFTISSENWEYAREYFDNDGQIAHVTYYFYPEWKEADTVYTVKHYLPDQEGEYPENATLTEKIALSVDEEEKVIFALPKSDGEFEGYVVDEVYTEEFGQFKATTSKDMPFTGTLEVYYRKPAEIKITKTVDGAFADRTQFFNFTITGTVKKGEICLSNQTYDATVNGQTITFNENGQASFSLKDGESITIQGLPAGWTFTVTEEQTPNYTQSITVDEEKSPDGTVKLSESGNTIAFVNTCTIAPAETGVSLPGGAGAMLGAGLAALAVLLALGRRRALR